MLPAEWKSPFYGSHVKKHDTQNLIGRIVFLTCGKSNMRHLIGCRVLRPACEPNLFRAFSVGKSHFLSQVISIFLFCFNFISIHYHTPPPPLPKKRKTEITRDKKIKYNRNVAVFQAKLNIERKSVSQHKWVLQKLSVQIFFQAPKYKDYRQGGGEGASKEICGTVRLPVWRHISRQWLSKWPGKCSSKRRMKILIL